MYKQNVQGETAGGKASLQCMRPSSELRHCNSSVFSMAICPACPQQDTSHASCQPGMHTDISTVFFTARWKEQNLCRRGQSDNRKDVVGVRELGMLAFMGSQKSSYTGCNVVCNFSLNPVLSCTAWDDKGNFSARGQHSNWSSEKTLSGAVRYRLLSVMGCLLWQKTAERQGNGKVKC